MPCERIKCPKCERDFGQELKFLHHLGSEHGISDFQSLYNDVVRKGEKALCSCGCGSSLLWAGWKKGYPSKYLRGHNASIDSVYLNPQKQAQFADKRREGYKSGKYRVWNDGLTKETSSKVLETSQKISNALHSGYKLGSILDWRKLNPEKAAEVATKTSKKMLEKYSTGEIQPWNKGLTKDTHSTLMSIAKKNSEKFNEREAGRRITSEDFLKRIKKLEDKFILVSDEMLYKRRRIDRLEFKCTKCEKHQMKSLGMLEESPVCFFCQPKESKAQIEIYDFVKSLSQDARLSDRTMIAPQELDIYVPSKNFAIEYNGLYWHSSANIADTKYHQKKQEVCSSAGIKLLSIYEDEWRDKRNIVMGMIKHRLCQPDKTWDARKLSVVTLQQKEAKTFFNDNHLEGSVPSAIVFGLRDEASGLLLAAMSLRKPFHKKHATKIEVGRCCSLAGHSIRGWIGKLTSAAKKYALSENSTSLMTYVDYRVGTGIGYTSAGWSVVSTGRSPRFWWTNFVRRFNRFKYKADKTRNMTQEQIAKEAGVVMIYGCPNVTLEINLVHSV